MPDISDPLILAGLLALIMGLFLYSILMPRNPDTWALNGEEGNNSKSMKIIAMLGSELYATLPQGVTIGKKANPRVEALLVRSGNPWKVNAQEFIFFQYIAAFLGFLIGWPAWILLNMALELPWYAVVGLTTVGGFLMPRLSYNDQAKKRDLDFKRQLPEALDLIVISLSGGKTFTQAVRDSLPNMQDGVLKEEFKEIINGIDTGKTLNEALAHFGNRAPNESIKTFVQAVREATALDVPIAEVLQSRAEASRQEFFALIHGKTAQLSSKMMGVLTPTLIPALLIIVLTPSLASLISSLG